MTTELVERPCTLEKSAASTEGADRDRDPFELRIESALEGIADFQKEIDGIQERASKGELIPGAELLLHQERVNIPR